jgi:hypothetical protein
MASKKTAWQNAKDLIVDYAINDLDKNYGIKATASQIAPKAHRDSPDHVLFFTEEFKGNTYYVMYKKDYKTFCDERGNTVEKPIYYRLNKDKVVGFNYEKVAHGSDKSWSVPVEHLEKLIPQIAEITEKEEDYQLSLELQIDDDVDENISAMTLRDFYAIVQNKPVSNKSWLNNLIKKDK